MALAPHSRMTKDTELPVLYRDVQKMVAGMAATPHLDKLLTLANCYASRREAGKGSTGSRKWWILSVLCISVLLVASWPPGHTARSVRK